MEPKAAKRFTAREAHDATTNDLGNRRTVKTVSLTRQHKIQR